MATFLSVGIEIVPPTIQDDTGRVGVAGGYVNRFHERPRSCEWQ